MMGDYGKQFETLTQAVEANNQELDDLRKQLGDA